MNTDETDLQMVRRHVRQRAGHVANQRALIAGLKERALPTGEAEVLLASFEDLQNEHEAHLARAEAKLPPR